MRRFSSYAELMRPAMVKKFYPSTAIYLSDKNKE